MGQRTLVLREARDRQNGNGNFFQQYEFASFREKKVSLCTNFRRDIQCGTNYENSKSKFVRIHKYYYDIFLDAQKIIVLSIGRFSQSDNKNQPLSVLECPQLPSSVPNGHTYGTGFLQGSLYRFSCRQGYSLIGHKTLLCTQDGNWNASVPRCLKGMSLMKFCFLTNLSEYRIFDVPKHNLGKSRAYGNLAFETVGPRFSSLQKVETRYGRNWLL